MKKSFTLIELIVVIAIIAILAAIIAPNAFKAIEKAKVTEIIGDFKAYKTAIYSLYADTGKWIVASGTWAPQHFNNHTSILVEDPGSSFVGEAWWNGPFTGWDGPYIEKIKPKSPWEGRYSIESWLDFDSSGGRELWLDFEDYCYPDGPHGPCSMPDQAYDQIEQKIDDGIPGDGNFRHGNSTAQTDSDIAWILVWDAY